MFLCSPQERKPKMPKSKIITSILITHLSLFCDLSLSMDDEENDTLNLNMQDLHEIPAHIFMNTHPIKLLLCHNKLEEIHPAIINLTNLRELHLYANRIKKIPSEMKTLVNLDSLDLGANQLGNRRLTIGHNTLGLDYLTTNLTSLNMRMNKIKNLPSEIGALTNLTELNVSKNKLKNLPPEIGNLISLRNIDLELNKLTHLPPEFSLLRI